jgi:hypothetical protein
MTAEAQQLTSHGNGPLAKTRHAIQLGRTGERRPPKDPRVSALRRFAVSITVLTILGLTVLGFEQAYATPVVGVLTAFAVELTLETVEARAQRRPVRFAGSPRQFADFLLPAHITGLACAMLLYANSDLWPVIFAVTVGVGSKYVIRVNIKGRPRHVLNPSNTGIVTTLLLFHWVGIAPPYQFTEWVTEPFSWLIPAAILAAGTMLNGQLTKKMPLIAGWVGGFALQAVIRTSVEHTATLSALLVMSGTAFVLFTNYMITDPGTTPARPWRQVAFGASAAATYGILVYLHVVFGLFFALTIVCWLRGLSLAAMSARQRAARLTQERSPSGTHGQEASPRPLAAAAPADHGTVPVPADKAGGGGND